MHGREYNIKINPKEKGYELDLNDSKQGSVVGSCVHGYEPSGFTKGREFLSQHLLVCQKGLYYGELIN
jgi:hypothetical protein